MYEVIDWDDEKSRDMFYVDLKRWACNEGMRVVLFSSINDIDMESYNKVKDFFGQKKLIVPDDDDSRTIFDFIRAGVPDKYKEEFDAKTANLK